MSVFQLISLSVSFDRPFDKLRTNGMGMMSKYFHPHPNLPPSRGKGLWAGVSMFFWAFTYTPISTLLDSCLRRNDGVLRGGRDFIFVFILVVL